MALANILNGDGELCPDFGIIRTSVIHDVPSNIDIVDSRVV